MIRTTKALLLLLIEADAFYVTAYILFCYAVVAANLPFPKAPLSWFSSTLEAAAYTGGFVIAGRSR